MKVVNIFGLVVAVHVVVLLLIFAIPGCRTTNKTPNRAENVTTGFEPTPTAPAASAPTPIRPAREFSSDLNPPLSSSGAYSTIDASPVTGSGGRASPTRPGTAAPGVSAPSPTASTPPPAQTYTVVRNDSLWSVAKKHGISVRELAAANNLSESASLQLDQTLTIPARKTEPAAAAVGTKAGNGAPAASEGTTYVVKAGDTLGSIARRNHTTVGAIRAMNNLRGDLVRVGDTLQIPQAAVASSNVPASTATPSAPGTTSTPAPARPAANSVKHIVAPGETLGDIARRYGVTIRELGTANNIDKPNQLAVGRELIVPNPQTLPNATPKAPEPTRYTPSYQPAPSAQGTPPPGETTLPPRTDENVPVIRVEEPVQTIRIQPTPNP
jgi:LysM repeat protein